MGGGPSVDRDSGFRLRPDEWSALLSGEIQPDGPFFRRERRPVVFVLPLVGAQRRRCRYDTQETGLSVQWSLRGRQPFGFGRRCEGLEISPVWSLGTGTDPEIEVASTDQAEGWSLYLRLASGEARVLHDARTMIGAARALVAADWGYGFPVTLEAWDMCCEAESLCALPEALRRAFRLRDARRGVCAGGVD